MLIGGVSTLDERGAVLDRTVFESDTSIGKSMPFARSFHHSTREMVEFPVDQEDELGDSLVSCIDVAADDAVGNGLDGCRDEELYDIPEDSWKSCLSRRPRGKEVNPLLASALEEMVYWIGYPKRLMIRRRSCR
jgi:hypothetical protein